MDDVFVFLVAWPGDIFLADSEGHAHRVHGRHKIAIFSKGFDNLAPHSCHNAHVRNDICRIGDFDADIGHGRADWPHGEGDDVHRASAHTAVKKRGEDRLHLFWVHPVVGRTSFYLAAAADKGAVLDAGHVAWVRACKEGVGAFFGVEGYEGSRSDERLADGVVFFFGAVAPIDKIGLAQIFHAGNPG